MPNSLLLRRAVYLLLFILFPAIVTQPANDLCTSATTVAFSAQIPSIGSIGLLSESSVGATTEVIVGTACSLHPSNEVWYKVTIDDFTTLEIQMCSIPGPTFDTVIALYTGNCNALTCVAFNDDQPPPICLTDPSAAAVKQTNLTPQMDYYIAVGGKLPGDAGEFPLFIRAEKLVYDHCGAVTITSGEVTPLVDFVNLNLDSSPSLPITDCVPSAQPTRTYTMWFTFDSGMSNSVSISSCGLPGVTSIPTGDAVYLSLYTGSCTTNLQCVNSVRAQSTDCGGAPSMINQPVTTGTQYFISSGLLPTLFVSPGTSSRIVILLNDQCGNAITITSGVTVSGSNYIASDDTESGGCAQDSGFIKGVWFKFDSGSNNRASLSLCGSDFNTVIGLYSGDCGSLVCVANNDNGACGTASELDSIVIAPGTQYYVVVGGKTSSDIGSFSLSLTLFTPPVNDFCSTALPLAGAPQTSNAGATNDLESGGCTPDSGFIRGLWYTFNAGSNTRVSLSLCGASFDSVIGLYSGQCGSLVCVARNDDSSSCAPASELTSIVITPGTQYYVAVGARTSSDVGTFTLTGTIFTPPPVNDQCSAPTSITTGTTLTGTNVAATSDTEGGACSPSGLIGNVWYTFNSGVATLVSLSLCGANFDTVIGLYSGQCGSLVCVARNDDSSSCSPASELNYISISTGTQYLISVGGKTASSIGSFSLSLNLFAPPTNDPCLGASTLQSGTPLPGTTIAATDDTLVTACTPSGLIGGVWYTFSSGSNTVASVSVCGANFDSVIALYTGTNCITMTCVASNDDGSSSCSPASELNNVLITQSTTYYIVVGGKTPSDFGTFTISLTLSSIPSNDLCSGAVQLFDGVPQSGTTAGALDDSSSILTRCGLPGEAGSNVWYYFDVPSAGYLSVSSCVASFDTVIGIYQGSCSNLNCVGFNDNNSPGCAPLSSSVTILAKVPSTRYFILVSGIGVGDFLLFYGVPV
jgi:hypothetical protein